MKKHQITTKAKAILVWAIASLILYMSAPTVFAAGTYSGGDGSEENSYLISDANDTQEIGANSDDLDKYFILTADIDLSGYVYSRAFIAPDTNDFDGGFQGTYFTGHFDGDDHTIGNLTIDSNCTGLDSDYLGIFGYISGGSELKNLDLTNVNIDTGTSLYVGALAGVNNGNIENCYTTGDVSGSRAWYVGGLVEWNDGTVALVK